MLIFYAIGFIVFLNWINLAAILRNVRSLIYQYNMARSIPGPRGWPIIGNLLDAPTTTEAIERSMKNLAKEFRDEMGATVAKMWVGPTLYVYPLDHTAAKEILKSPSEGRKSDYYSIMGRLMGNGLVTAWGEQWHKNRRLVNQMFGAKPLNDYTAIVEGHTEHFIEHLHKRADGKEHNFFRDIYSFGFDVIHDIGMGEKLSVNNTEEKVYFKMFGQFFRTAFYQAMFPITQYFPFSHILGLEQKLQESIRTVKDFSNRTVIKKREEQAKVKDEEFETRHTFLDMLLQLNEQGKMTMTEVDDELLTLMFAGHDTTALSLLWTFWALATHPDVQAQLQAELDHHFPDKPKRVPVAELNNLPFLNAVLKEVMRVTPPVPAFQRKIEDDLLMNGHTIPKGATVIVAPYIMHRDPKVFSNPDVFDPSHFLNNNDIPAYSYFPFSAGVRNCAGQKLAWIELRIMVAQVMLNFTMKTERAYEDNKLLFSVALAPSLGLPIKLEPR